MYYGGIDLGGTKIEACLHDSNFMALERRRVATPKDYPALLEALAAQISWLKQTANRDDLPIGMGIPGFIDAHTGLAYTVNLCAMGKPLATDLAELTGMMIPMANDCKCFALSEANREPEQVSDLAHSSMFGLILGTGVGGGFCLGGQLHPGWSGGGGEVGHMGVPAHIVARFNLPLWTCGCSRTACYEAYLAGRGLERLGRHLCGVAYRGEDLAQNLQRNDPQAHKILGVWAAIAGELIHAIQLTFDPQYIVLGGGLSLLPDIDQVITEAFQATKLVSTLTPHISIAKFGDSSGVRGAAMLSRKNQV